MATGLAASVATAGAPSVTTYGATDSIAARIGFYDERSAQNVVWENRLQRMVEFYSDSLCGGRATGTRGSAEAAFSIARHFRKAGLLPFDGSYSMSFYTPDSIRVGHNIIGMLPGSRKHPVDSYIIVGAHYDHLGILDGNIYNGADDNASGVTVLLNLADMFGTMRKTKTGPDKNIIFAALDAKELNMAGSKAFVDRLIQKESMSASISTIRPASDTSRNPEEEFPGIPKDRIICAINIDQIGTVLEPVHEADTNFVIVLGENTLPKKHRGLIDMCNRYYNINLDIDHTFYGSENFTDLFYRLSDQIVFHEAGIPALIFTSGFHRHTYKTTDDPDIISYPVMKKRTMLIFYLTLML